jgi:virulence factor
MPLKTVRVGLVGAGSIAQIAELPALTREVGVEIAGVVTATRQSCARNLDRWPIERGYESAEEMIAEAKLDALFVLTPKKIHTPFIKMGLEAGLDIFAEKPLTTSLQEAREVVELAEKINRILMVAFNRRYAEVYVRARQEFADGFPQFVVAQKNRVGSEYRATLENAIHMVDLLRWFCGEPEEITAHAIAADPFEEDGSMALIRFNSGSIGALVAARTAGEWDERLDAYGRSKSVRVVAPDSVAISENGQTSTVEMRPRAYGWADVNVTMGFGPEVTHFLDCVRNRIEPRTSGKDALKTQILVDEILKAAGLPLEDNIGEE